MSKIIKCPICLKKAPVRNDALVCSVNCRQKKRNWKMKAEEAAKDAGFNDLKELALLVGETAQMLSIWFIRNKRKWETMLRIGGQRKEKEERYKGEIDAV